jgi:hypothetical protein
MRVRLTHYTISAEYLKLWVVGRSLDGASWTEIDQKTNIWDFKDGWYAASFTVSKPAECRFIRLTQTGKNHTGADYVELFGTLSE